MVSYNYSLYAEEWSAVYHGAAGLGLYLLSSVFTISNLRELFVFVEFVVRHRQDTIFSAYFTSIYLNGRKQFLIAEIVFYKILFFHLPECVHFCISQRMTNYVEVGQELMPNRDQVDVSSKFHSDTYNGQFEATEPTTPIRKLSRNRGLVLQEQ